MENLLQIVDIAGQLVAFQKIADIAHGVWNALQEVALLFEVATIAVSTHRLHDADEGKTVEALSEISGVNSYVFLQFGKI